MAKIGSLKAKKAKVTKVKARSKAKATRIKKNRKKF